MILYSILSDFKPVKRFQNRSDVLEFWNLYNISNKSILDVLETIYLILRKTYRELQWTSVKCTIEVAIVV